MIKKVQSSKFKVQSFRKILGFVVLGISFGVLLTACGNTTYAVSAIDSLHQNNDGLVAKDRLATKSANREENQMANLIARADKEIERRITSLNNAMTRVNSLKKLTSDQKSSFAAQLQAQIDSLTSLKAKIDADTDMVTLKDDVKSVVGAYRIYALYMPQISILVASNEVLATVDLFNSYITKLQAKIDAAKALGSNVTSLQLTLTDMQTKVNDAWTQANNASSSAQPLTPAGYPGNISTLKAARTDLKVARADLQTARKDAELILKGLRGLSSSSSGTRSKPISTSSASE